MARSLVHAGLVLTAVAGLAACEGLFGVDFDGLTARPGPTMSPDGGGSDADVRDDGGCAATDPAQGCGSCTPCATAEHGVAACEEGRCAIACDPGYRRCSAGCCPLFEAALAAGTRHTCATAQTGALYCWGDNASGQLGDRTRDDRSTPKLVFGLEGGARGVAVGVDFSFSVATSGAVSAWGENRFGSLADGTTTARLSPWPVEALGLETRFVVAAGWHACAVSRTGRVSCWGYNVAGAVGDGTTSEVRTPKPLVQAEPFVAIAKSTAHACGVGVSGALHCWGNNDRGQLGIDAGTVSLSPVRVPNVVDAADVATGSGHTCIATRAGGVRCWGSNVQSQLGVGDDDPRSGIVDVLPASAGVRQIAAGDDYTCVVSAAGVVSCWGFLGANLGMGTNGADVAPLPVVVDVGGAVASLSAGAKHACTRLLDGRVRCWGSNTSGQLGDGTKIDRRAPVDALLPD